MDDEAKFKELLEDEAFTSKLATLETAEEVKAAFEEKGVHITVEQINAIHARLASGSGELSDDDLEVVAGGGVDDLVDIVVDGVGKIGDKVHEWTRGRW